jgi:GDP-L-fucose synthase
MVNLKNKIILVTGGNGFLGKYVVELLKKENCKKVIVPRSNKIDLREMKNCLKVTKGVDYVVHLAANVGGIGYNMNNSATLYYDNITMGTFMLEASRINKVKKFLGLGTVCAYPKDTKIPFKESDLWMGYPEETNAPYGLAKKMLLVQSQAYRKQYNFNSIYLLPVNLYGPGDNFSLESSHVIPALIRRFYEARLNRSKAVTIWGTGKATREFLYVADAARGVVMALKRYNKSEPVNLGSQFEISISNLAIKISKIMKYNGKIKFDKSKPDGQPRRKLDTSKAYKEFEFKSKITFLDGLKKTVDRYIKEYDKNT